MMHPYSYTANSEPDHASDLRALSDYVNAHEFASAPVRSGPAASTLKPAYTASGTTLDYMAEVPSPSRPFISALFLFISALFLMIRCSTSSTRTRGKSTLSRAAPT